jgi:hypothetical protein
MIRLDKNNEKYPKKKYTDTRDNSHHWLGRMFLFTSDSSIQLSNQASNNPTK